jgi:putative autoinducer-2 (AI-2) aldolase
VVLPPPPSSSPQGSSAPPPAKTGDTANTKIARMAKHKPSNLDTFMASPPNQKNLFGVVSKAVTVNNPDRAFSQILLYPKLLFDNIVVKYYLKIRKICAFSYYAFVLLNCQLYRQFLSHIRTFPFAWQFPANYRLRDRGELITFELFQTLLRQGHTMDWGLKNRLSRIFRPETGKTVMLAVDHGYFLGPTSGLENVGHTVAPLLPYADSLMLTRGILRTAIPPESKTPIVLRVSGGNSIIGKDLSNEDITTDIDDAIRLNVSAITSSIYVGTDNEHQTIMGLADLVDLGQAYGIPVLAVTAVGRDMVRDARYLSLCCRIAAEMGAHFVKTYFVDDFEKIVESCPIPIVIAGGKKLPEKDALQMAHNAISQGASGVDMGRNIFQSDNPVGMIQAVRAVVHDGASVDDAFDIYKTTK